MNLDPYSDDPVYNAIRASARAKRAQERAGKIKVDQQIAGAGGDSPSPGTDTGISIRGPVTSVTPINTPTPTPEYGMTKGYGMANRVGEAIGSNLNPIAASIAFETVAPLKGAAIGVAIDSVLGDAPGYLTQDTREGVRTQVSGFDATKTYGQFPDGRVAEVTAEDIATGGFKTITAAEANRLNPTGYIGADPRTPLGAIGKGLQTLATSIMPLSGMIFGKTVTSPIGTPMAMGAGPFGPMVHDRMYETHGNMVNGIPGNYGMRIGNRYVTYNANPEYIGGKLGETLGFKSAMTAGMNMSTEQFQQLYGARAGFDYRTVDWENSKPGEIKGDPLQGFVSGKGGFTKDGQFLDSQGRLNSNLSMNELNAYTESAVRSGSKTAEQVAAELERKSRMVAGDLFFGEARQKTYAEAAASVREQAQRAVEQTQAAYPGRQAVADYNQLAKVGPSIADMLTDPTTLVDTSAQYDMGLGLTDTGGYETLSGYSSVGKMVERDIPEGSRYDPTTGNTYNFNLEPDNDDNDDDGYDPNEAYGNAPNDGTKSDTYFAQGGFVEKKAVGGEAGVGPVGFVNGRAPEEVSEQKTIADDVEGQVPEGTFVLNAPAVERAGSSDVRKMLVKAIAEAEAQGIDLSAQGGTMDSEEAVSVAVSEGEVLIPPVLARIIGYDRLEKMNKRGEAEVQKRQQESEASPQEPQTAYAKLGGFISKPA